VNDFLIFVFDCAWRSSLVVLLGAVCAGLLWKRSAASRNLIWRITLVAALIAPMEALIEPRLATPVPIQTVQQIDQLYLPSRIESGLPIPKVRPTFLTASSLVVDPKPVEFDLVLYGLVVVGLIGRWLVAYVRIRRIAEGAEPEPAEPGQDVRLAKDPALQVPVTFGLFRPVILLPGSAEGWPNDMVETAILHERAHIARKDWLWKTLSTFVTALNWFNPFFWVVQVALDRTAEGAADDCVLRSGVSASSYAGKLLSVSESIQIQMGASVAMARRGGVKDRLKRILATEVDRQTPGVRLAATTGLVFTLSGLVLAALKVSPSAVDVIRHLHPHLHPNVQKDDPLVSEAEIPGGGEAKLVYLFQGDPVKGRKWLPDGTPYNNTDPLKGDSVQSMAGEWKLGADSIGGFFKFTGLRCTKDRGPAVHLSADGQDSGVGIGLGLGFEVGGTDKMSGLLLLAKEGTRRKTASYNVQIGADPLQVYAKCKAGEPPLDFSVGPRIASQHGEYVMVDGKQVPRVVNTYDPDQCSVKIEIPASLEGTNVEAEVTDPNGKRLYGSWTYASTIDSHTGMHTRTTDVQAKQDRIGTVTLLTRPWRLVKLTGIHLQPNAAP